MRPLLLKPLAGVFMLHCLWPLDQSGAHVAVLWSAAGILGLEGTGHDMLSCPADAAYDPAICCRVVWVVKELDPENWVSNGGTDFAVQIKAPQLDDTIDKVRPYRLPCCAYRLAEWAACTPARYTGSKHVGASQRPPS